MLVQQESKIGGRLMGRSDGQEHVLANRAVQFSIHENASSADWTDNFSNEFLVKPTRQPRLRHPQSST
jgi:hypothetical protein